MKSNEERSRIARGQDDGGSTEENIKTIPVNILEISNHQKHCKKSKFPMIFMPPYLEETNEGVVLTFDLHSSNGLHFLQPHAKKLRLGIPPHIDSHEADEAIVHYIRSLLPINIGNFYLLSRVSHSRKTKKIIFQGFSSHTVEALIQCQLGICDDFVKKYVPPILPEEAIFLTSQYLNEYLKRQFYFDIIILSKDQMAYHVYYTIESKIENSIHVYIHRYKKNKINIVMSL